MIVALLLLILGAGLVVALVSPRLRPRTMRYLGLALGGTLAAYLVIRGVGELWLIDFDQPDTYRNDWGGPSLVGVLTVHTGPAVVIVIASLVRLRHWRRGPLDGNEDSQADRFHQQPVPQTSIVEDGDG